jgi:hypothetical protein
MRQFAVLLSAALLVATACRESTNPPPADPMPGDYPLRAIDGNAPPQIVFEDTSGRFSLLAGLVRLNADRSFVDSTDVQFVSSTGQVNVQSDVARGTWRVSHDTLFLLPAGSPSYHMAITVNGIELTQEFLLDESLPPVMLVYRK